MNRLYYKSLFLILGIPCFAAPITTLNSPITITGGFLEAAGPTHNWLLVADGPPSFSLTGAQTGSFLGGIWIGHAGDPVNVSGVAADIFGGTGTIDGSTGALKYKVDGTQQSYGTYFSFSAPPITAGSGTFQFPFTFSGFISAALVSPANSDCILCEVPIEGSGIGTITFTDVVGHPGDVESSSMIYQFNVPEPGSAWLLGAGLLTAALAGQIRKLRLH